MPLTINKIHFLPVKKSIIKHHNKKLRQQQATFKDNASSIMNNSHFNKAENLIFTLVDKLTPISKKHSKVYSFLVLSAEKTIKLINKVSQNKTFII